MAVWTAGLLLARVDWGDRTSRVPNDRSGLISTELGYSRHVRFPSETDRTADITERQLRANSRYQAGPLRQLIIAGTTQTVRSGFCDKLAGRPKTAN
jgi:hypothetical protein